MIKSDFLFDQFPCAWIAQHGVLLKERSETHWSKSAGTSFGTSSTTKDGKTLGRDFCLYCVLVFHKNDTFASVINYSSMSMAVTLPHQRGHLNFLQKNQSRLMFQKSSTPVSLLTHTMSGWFILPFSCHLPPKSSIILTPSWRLPLVFLTQFDYFPSTFLPLPVLLCHTDIPFSCPSNWYCRREEHCSRDLAVYLTGV